MAEQPHHQTPTKSRILGAIEYMERYKIPYFKRRLFALNGVPVRTGNRILKEHRDRRLYNDPQRLETRSRPRSLTPRDLELIEQLI
ncbi:HMG box protein [Verticillium dahliae]